MADVEKYLKDHHCPDLTKCELCKGMNPKHTTFHWKIYLSSISLEESSKTFLLIMALGFIGAILGNKSKDIIGHHSFCSACISSMKKKRILSSIFCFLLNFILAISLFIFILSIFSFMFPKSKLFGNYKLIWLLGSGFFMGISIYLIHRIKYLGMPSSLAYMKKYPLNFHKIKVVSNN